MGRTAVKASAIAEASQGERPKNCTCPERAMRLDPETHSFAASSILDIYLIILNLTGDEFLYI